MSVGLKARIARQFMHPRGAAGFLAGRLMARKNRERIIWAVREMGIKPGERVLEVGYGPGVALEQIFTRVPDCEVFGLDSSTIMHAQAGRRNRHAIESGHVSLKTMPAEDYAGQDGPFDLIFSINTLPFCSDPAAVVQKAVSWLNPGGRIVIIHQIPMKSADDSVVDARESEFKAWLSDAGLRITRAIRLPARPNPVLFVDGQRTAGLTEPGHAG
jgi:cyclopropane fatty-acyl-phospholipid synthase-like methyltransferase